MKKSFWAIIVFSLISFLPIEGLAAIYYKSFPGSISIQTIAAIPAGKTFKMNSITFSAYDNLINFIESNQFTIYKNDVQLTGPIVVMNDTSFQMTFNPAVVFKEYDLIQIKAKSFYGFNVTVQGVQQSLP